MDPKLEMKAYQTDLKTYRQIEPILRITHNTGHTIKTFFLQQFVLCSFRVYFLDQSMKHLQMKCQD